MNGPFEIFGMAVSISATGLVVVVILSLLSVWSVGVSIERLIVLSRARRQSLAFARAVSLHLSQGKPQPAIEAARKFPTATWPGWWPRGSPPSSRRAPGGSPLPR